MGKITFFELKNFQGKTYECNSDFLDLQTNLNSCNSIRVEHGLWMVYERPNYMGNQYFLIVGEYPDYHHWTGVNDSIKSCRLLSQPAGLDLYKMRVYEKDDCQGELMDFVDDCPDVQSHFHYPNISSCHVLDGLWLFYEDPNYSGKQYLLRPGQYERFTDWGAIHGKIGSLKRVVEPL